MKKLLTGLVTIAISLSAMAEVPSLINYQGRLKEKNGTNVNGTKNFTVRIFDAKTGGKQIYEENVGAVTINEGAYSFGFGEAGKSVVTSNELLAVGDGEKQVFNYTVDNSPILGNLMVTSGDLKWDETAGSSDGSKFTATINKTTGVVAAIFLQSAPSGETKIFLEYDYHSPNVLAALSQTGDKWLEITVENESLIPRERLVTVPYSVKAGSAERLSKSIETVLMYIPSVSADASWKTLNDRKPVNFTQYQMQQMGRIGRFSEENGLNIWGFKTYFPNNLDEVILKLTIKEFNLTGPASNPIRQPLNVDFYLDGKEKFKRTGENTYMLKSPKEGVHLINSDRKGYIDAVHNMNVNASIIITGRIK